MNVPNWQHHSRKEQKPTLKPQAMRDRRTALQHLKKKYKNPSEQSLVTKSAGRLQGNRGGGHPHRVA